MTYKKKVFFFIYTNVFLIFFVLIAQVIVDPYGIFKFIHIDQLNGKTYLDRSKGRVEKSLHLKIHNNYETIIIGTSRAQGGIDNSSLNLKDTKVFNASMSGTYFQEISKVLSSLLMQQENMKSLIYGIDFYTFTYVNPKFDHFEKSLYNEENYFLPTLIKKLLSWDSLKDMSESISLNIKKSKQAYWTSGQEHRKILKRNHRRLFDKVMPQYFHLYSFYKGRKYIFEKFEKTLIMYSKKNIDVSIFISPIHAHQMVIIDSLGLLPDYYEWMKQITLIIGKVNTTYNSNIKLFNFSGFNSITTEEIPSNKDDQMHYYNESSHYKIATGDLVLNKIFNHNNSVKDFGVLLTPINIDKHISRIEKNRKKYYNAFPEEINHIKQRYIKYKENKVK